MAKASKRKRCDGVRKSVCTARKDSISGLPNPILCLILSYLPTKEAVRTSVLSKGWSDVWTSIPCIDIDDDRSSPPAERYSSEFRDSFMDFVDRVLRLNDVSCLRRLHISFNELYNLSRARQLINDVIMRDVEELDVAFLSVLRQSPQCLGKLIELLPPRLFTREKLVILKLKNCCNITLNVPTSVYLPCLKILHLHQIRFLNNNFVENLLDGCPVIEELDIEYVRYKDGGKMLLVRSSSLKSLRVQAQYICFDQVKSTIVVDAKNLERINIKEYLKIDYDMVNISSLVEVKFDICKCCSAQLRPDISGHKSLQLLRTLSNTEHLFLSSQTTETLAHAHWNDLPGFHSLKHLELKTLDYSWSVISVLLECSPNLRTLVVHKEQSRENQVQFQEPKCLILKLEEIEFKGFKGWAAEMEMVRYFLKNATVLKKMSIQSYFSGSKKHTEISKKLLTFARGSNECQIIFG